MNRNYVLRVVFFSPISLKAFRPISLRIEIQFSKWTAPDVTSCGKWRQYCIILIANYNIVDLLYLSSIKLETNHFTYVEWIIFMSFSKICTQYVVTKCIPTTLRQKHRSNRTVFLIVCCMCRQFCVETIILTILIT